jgi:ribonucleoside-diphosphate reductase alpha chain
MGLADLMYHTGIRYGSEEGQEFAAQVMEFIRFHSMKTSVMLAEKRGAFPAIQGSIYDPNKMVWQPPEPIQPYQSDFLRPAIDWQGLMDDICQHGIRNAAQTTVAPTGTIATVAGCEGYGCEPVFALAYIRHVNDNGNDMQLVYSSPQFEKALKDAGLEEATRQDIINQAMEHGTCQDIAEVPESIRRVFVVSADISAEEHVRMQAALQAFVDNSLSKTINFPSDATPAEVSTAYQLAWELGCKGITVYVTGTRQKVVLETKATALQKQVSNESAALAEPIVADSHQLSWYDKKKPRPRHLPGYTYTIGTPLGKAFVTINENGGNHPFEVFINTSKAGSDTAAVSEAIGRLISYILRIVSHVAPRERLKEVVRQLSGIGGGRSLGFGPNRVRSLPDGVAQVISEYLENTLSEYQNDADFEENSQSGDSGGNGYHLQEALVINETKDTESGFENNLQKIGDLCPECGQAAVVNEEGCRKCYACGFSEC